MLSCSDDLPLSNSVEENVSEVGSSRTEDLSQMSNQEKAIFFQNLLDKDEFEVKSRSETYLTAEDAGLGIETLLNLYFARIPANPGGKDTTSAALSISKSTVDRISEADYNYAYLTAHAWLANFWTNSSLSGKQVEYVDITLIGETSTKYKYSLKASVVEGLSGSSSTGDCEDAFSIPEELWIGDWLFADHNGPCDDFSLDTEKSATAKMENAVNAVFLQDLRDSAPVDLNCDYSTVINLSREEISGFNHFTPDYSPNGDIRFYLMFSNYSGNPHFDELECVDEAEGEWYTCNMVTIAKSPGVRPSNKFGVTTSISYDFSLCSGCTSAAHLMDIRYGNPVYECSSGGYVNPPDSPYPNIDFETDLLIS